MAEPYKKNQIMVGTFNMAGQNWMGAQERARVMANVFRNTNAQLIGFQEFGLHTKEMLKPARRDEIQYLLGEKLGHIYINTIGYDYTRFTPLKQGTIWLCKDHTCNKGWDGSIRGASWAIFADAKTEAEFLFFNVHLDNKGKEARIKGIERILIFIELEFPQIPAILTADSNLSVDSPKLNKAGISKMWADPELRKPYELMLEAGFVDTWVESHPNMPRPCTYHGFSGHLDYEIDEWGTWDTEWIFTRGFQVHNCLIIRDSEGGTYPSDHYWMKAQLDFIGS